VWCWGTNERAELGFDAGVLPDGGPRDGLLPGRVTLPKAIDEPTLLSGRAFSTCLRAGGEILCWGANGVGQLMTGDFADRFQPTRPQF
jgi:alpha-tubulin suppressor-like RCC1 family protein